VSLLLKEGAEVRCLVRPDADDSALRGLGVDVVRGDLTDPTSLPAACKGVATVVATATVIARRLAGARKPTLQDVDHDGMLALIEVAESAGVERFVYVSYPGVDAGVTPLDRAKRANERRLSTSTMRTAIIRSDAFQEVHLGPLARFDIAAGKVAIIGRGDTPQRWVGTDDVAALVAAVATEADAPRLITVGGPEAMSKNEAVAIVEKETGRRMKVQRMPRGVARVAMRVLQRPNDAMSSVIGLGLMQDTHAADWDDQAFRDRGIDPRPASDFLREQAERLG
jgi:uncharacterized protein YbjT (DUF2867 family)